jgi:hypothetical protein
MQCSSPGGLGRRSRAREVRTPHPPQLPRASGPCQRGRRGRSCLTLRSSWCLYCQAAQASSSPALPLPCHSQQSRPVPSGRSRDKTTTAATCGHHHIPSQRTCPIRLGSRRSLPRRVIDLAVPGRPIRSLVAEDRSAAGVRDRTGPEPSVRAGSVAHRDHRGTDGPQRSPAAKRNRRSASLQVGQLAQRQQPDQIVVPKVGVRGPWSPALARRFTGGSCAIWWPVGLPACSWSSPTPTPACSRRSRRCCRVPAGNGAGPTEAGTK